MEEEILTVNPSETDELDANSVSAFHRLKSGMEEFCMVYATGFQELVEVHEATKGETLEDSVQLILTDPPYNIRRQLNAENSNYDVLTVHDMNDIVTQVSSMLLRGGHGHIFCASLQFETWYRMFDKREV